MQQYDFDKTVSRKNTMSLKYDFAEKWGKPTDILPLWVADMDFPTAPGVLQRLEEVVKHGIFGYSDGKEAYFQAVKGWYATHFGWEVEESWLVKTPGVVFAIAAAVRAFTGEGEAVLIQPPVYHPFSNMVLKNGRKLVNNPLQLKNGRYEIDFQDFEEKIKENQVKLFILCSPHNPVGRVWEEWELRKMAELCVRYDVVIVSDEIHSDFVYPGKKHHVLASLGEDYAERTVTCTAPSKTFNLAGLQTSNIFISNQELRKRFQDEMGKTGYSNINLMGLAACQAAYESGGEWLAQLKGYLKGNLDFVREFLKERLPEIKLVEPEGTYLIWLDFRALSLTEEEREALIVEKAGLWLDSGAMFGAEGEGFERVNIACPRQTLQLALEKLERAVKEIG